MKIKKILTKLRICCFKLVSDKIDITDILFGEFKAIKQTKKSTLKDMFTFLGIPFILTIFIVYLLHGHFSILTFDAIFVSLAILTPIMFNFLMNSFSIDKVLLKNEKDHKIVKEFNDNVSFIIVICLLVIFLILMRVLFENIGGIIVTIITFFVVWGLLIIGLKLIQILNKLIFLAKERLKEIKP